jgi:hypothetical protein
MVRLAPDPPRVSPDAATTEVFDEETLTVSVPTASSTSEIVNGIADVAVLNVVDVSPIVLTAGALFAGETAGLGAEPGLVVSAVVAVTVKV